MGGPGAWPAPAVPECVIYPRSDGLPHLQDGPPGSGEQGGGGEEGGGDGGGAEDTEGGGGSLFCTWEGEVVRKALKCIHMNCKICLCIYK